MNEGLYGWERGEKLYKSSIHIWNSQEIKKIKNMFLVRDLGDGSMGKSTCV